MSWHSWSDAGASALFEYCTVDDALDELGGWQFGNDPRTTLVQARYYESSGSVYDTQYALEAGQRRLQKRARERAEREERRRYAPPPVKLIGIADLAFPDSGSERQSTVLALGQLVDKWLESRTLMWFTCDDCGATGAWWFAPREDVCPSCKGPLPDDDSICAPTRPWVPWEGSAQRVRSEVLAALDGGQEGWRTS